MTVSDRLRRLIDSTDPDCCDRLHDTLCMVAPLIADVLEPMRVPRPERTDRVICRECWHEPSGHEEGCIIGALAAKLAELLPEENA